MCAAASGCSREKYTSSCWEFQMDQQINTSDGAQRVRLALTFKNKLETPNGKHVIRRWGELVSQLSSPGPCGSSPSRTGSELKHAKLTHIILGFRTRTHPSQPRDTGNRLKIQQDALSGSLQRA